MKLFFLILFFLGLSGCTNRIVDIPIAIQPKSHTVKPLGDLAVLHLTDKSTAGEVMSAYVSSLYKQQNYISYLFYHEGLKIETNHK